MIETSPANGWEEFAVVLGECLEAILGEPVSGLDPATHLLDDVGLDSFGVLVLIDDLEARLGSAVPQTDAEPTVGNLFELLPASTWRRLVAVAPRPETVDGI